MLKCTARVVGRVDEYALDLSRELLFERFEGEEIVAKHEAVVEKVVVREAVLGVIRLLWVIEQDARLKPRTHVLADPSQLELLLFVHQSKFQGRLAAPKTWRRRVGNG